METPKQKAIRDAYGHLWDKVKTHVNEMGWIDISIASALPKYHNIPLDKEMNAPMTGIFRPTGLRGIQTNNGWISILSKSDLPSKWGKIHFIIKGFESDNFTGYFDGELFWNLNEAYTPEIVTHYQTIEKPNPPIY